MTIQNRTLPSRAPMATPRPAPRATHASTARWLDVLGADRQPCQSPPSLLSHGHGGAPTRTPAGCQPSGWSTCGSTAATAWVVERGTTISRHGHSPRRPDRCWSRPDQGGRDGGTRPPMAQALSSEDPAAVGAVGAATSTSSPTRWPSSGSAWGNGERTEIRVLSRGLDRMDDQEPLHDTLVVSHRHGFL
jgi:hypothetical protein